MENLNLKIGRNSEILANQVDGELVMMSIENGKYYGMNPTGNLIWNLLETETVIADLLSTLATRFSLTEEKCKSDVLPFVEKLVSEKILVISES